MNEQQEKSKWHILAVAVLPVVARLLLAVGLILLAVLGLLPPGAEKCLALVGARL